MVPTRWFVLAFTLLLVGCASAPPAENGQTVRRQANRITAEELQAAQHANAYEALQSLRPQWLRARATDSSSGVTPVVVYLDGTRVGGPETLRQIVAVSVISMEFLSGTDATHRFGSGHANGAILVRTRR